jgi:dinuclear metal center YbgI/SA1388 family protein
MDWAPLKTKLDYDNVGLLIGKPDKPVSCILICLDVTDEIVKEAIDVRADLIVAHHPVIFKKLSSVTTADPSGRLIYRLIQNDIAVITAHTNLDAAMNGVSFALAEKIGLKNCRFLESALESLQCIRFICSPTDADELKNLLDEYKPVFQPGDSSTLRVEFIIDSYRTPEMFSKIRHIQPDFEDDLLILPAGQKSHSTGFGVTGNLEREMDQDEFLSLLSERLQSDSIRFAGKAGQIKKVAVCGGSGVMLAGKAIAAGADAFVTADIKYHDFFIGKSDFLLVDAGHYETEAPIIDIIAGKLESAFPGTEIRTTAINTNPVQSYHKSLQINRNNE